MSLKDIKARIDDKSANVAVIGFGYIGTCIGAVLAEKGYKVTGIDIREKIVDEINKGKTSIAEPYLPELIKKTVTSGSLKASRDFSEVKNADILVVTVGTPLGENFDPDTKDITAAFTAMWPYLHKNQVIILKSTVPPGTTEDVVKPLIEKSGLSANDYYLSFCPERLAEGKAIEEFKTIPVVVGGVNDASTEISAYFWNKSMGLETIKVDGAKAAEMVKLADNLWIDLNVALANEVAMLCQKMHVDVLQVISAANSLPKGKYNVNILHPSIGVGGYCLTKDPWFVHHMGKQMGFELKTPVASRNVNDGMPDYSFKLIESNLKEQGKKISDCKIAVLGISFKNNTGDCRYTPTKPIIELLEKSGCKLELYDPWVHDEEAHTVTKKQMSKDIQSTLSGADAVLFFTGHDEFQNLSIEKIKSLVKPKAFLLDGRNFFSKERIKQTKEAGLNYKGIGR